MQITNSKSSRLSHLLRRNRRRGPKVMSIAGRRTRRAKLLRALGSR
jgi:hypothetical protein